MGKSSMPCMEMPPAQRYVCSRLGVISAIDLQVLQALAEIRRKSRALMMFASMQRYRMSAEVYGQLTRLDVAVAH